MIRVIAMATLTDESEITWLEKIRYLLIHRVRSNLAESDLSQYLLISLINLKRLLSDKSLGALESYPMTKPIESGLRLTI